MGGVFKVSRELASFFTEFICCEVTVCFENEALHMFLEKFESFFMEGESSNHGNTIVNP